MTSMMGFQDPNEDIWEALFWDDILKEFGPGGYVEMRYMGEEVETIEQRPV